MRLYGLAALIALAGVGMLTGTAVISHHKPAPATARAGGRGGSVWGAGRRRRLPHSGHALAIRRH